MKAKGALTNSRLLLLGLTAGLLGLSLRLSHCANGPGEAEARPRLSVSRSLPVRGKSVRLSAAADPQRLIEGLSHPRVKFLARPSTGGAREIGRVHLSASGLATMDWTPRELGPHQLWCEIPVTGKTLRSEAIEAFVTPHLLHFNYWSCPPSQRYVTSVLAPKDEETALAASWLSRGVLPLRWKWGYGIAKEWKTAETYAEDWKKLAPSQAGIMIDEFGSGEPIDQLMGRALSLVRKEAPGLFLAPYCMGVDGDGMVAGFRDADLILVECYVGDWRGYGVFDRWRSTRKHELAGKALAVLGLGPDWVTTEKELRRQVAYIRTTMPEMPGLAFFPGASDRLMQAVDRAIYDYYLAPAVLLTTDAEGHTAEVRNLGCLPAKQVSITLVSREGKTQRCTVRRLEPEASERFPLPQGYEPRLEAAPGKYTVIRYQDPSKLPPPDMAAQTAASAYRERFRAADRVRPLAGSPKLDIAVSESDKPEHKGKVESATIAVPPSNGRSVALTFDVELGRVWFYGSVGVKLAGEGSLGFSWCHHEPDTDVAGSVPRAYFTFGDAKKTVARETLPPAMGPDRRFRLFASYDAKGFVRGMLLKHDGGLLWDTGDLPVDPSFRCDRLRLEVLPFEGSEIRHEAEAARLFLRSVSGGPLPSPYVLESWVSNAEVAYVD